MCGLNTGEFHLKAKTKKSVWRTTMHHQDMECFWMAMKENENIVLESWSAEIDPRFQL